jgi:hypothetical protein
MYIKVEGIKGDVVKPSAFVGWIEASYMSWPGGTVAVDATNGTARNSGNYPMNPGGKDQLDGFNDFPSKAITNGDFEVVVTRGKHTVLLMERAVNGRDPFAVDIWVPLDHNKLLKAAFSGVMVASIYTRDPRTEQPVDTFTFNAKSGKLRTA